LSSTTERSDALLERHAATIERSIERFGLPIHVYFLTEMKRNAAGFLQTAADLYPNTIVAFAVKANPCRGAVRAAKRFGLGADTASEHELRAALEEGIPPERITCNGNAKSDEYLRLAINSGAYIALDNRDEIDALERLVVGLDRSASVLVRFRGMPLAGLTSADQTTAADWTKFGFHIDEADAIFRRLTSSPHLRTVGISAHIGTQITDPSGYVLLLEYLFSIAERAEAAGIAIERIDIGGGFPVSFLTEGEWTEFKTRHLARVRREVPIEEGMTWNDLPLGYAHLEKGGTDERWIGKSYFTRYPGATMLEHLLLHRFPDGETTLDKLERLGSPTLVVEPGRSLIASCGITLSRVMGAKRVLGHNVVSLDLGINNHGSNLIAPDIFPAAVLPKRPDDPGAEAFLAGRLCFSGDMISKIKISLNRLPERGERFVIYHTGAYGADHFAGHSCGFPRPGKVAIREDGTAEVWRRPDRFEDVFGSAGDRLTLD